MIFEGFSDNARVWVYQSDRALDKNEVDYLEKQLAYFVDQWSAHGKKLKASAEILDSFRVVICTEGNVEASGCSIDASVRYIKEMGAELKVDFFNRLQILALKDNQKELIPFAKLREQPETEIFHPAITQLKELRENPVLKAKDYLNLH